MGALRGHPSLFNATTYFVDRHVDEGRADSVAIECGDRRLTYRDLHEQVNRVGTALRSQLGVRPEERIVLLMLDGPEMIAAFFGAIKIGAVPVPLNTRWTAAEYEYAILDSSATGRHSQQRTGGRSRQGHRRLPVGAPCCRRGRRD